MIVLDITHTGINDFRTRGMKMTESQPNKGLLKQIVQKSGELTINIITLLMPVLVIGTFVFILASVFLPYLTTSAQLDTSKTLLHELGDAQIARGLITFLVAVSTVGIAFSLVFFISFGGAADQSQHLEQRFALGKEILLALVGILGTIIGYYFGQEVGKQASQAANEALRPAQTTVAPTANTTPAPTAATGTGKSSGK